MAKKPPSEVSIGKFDILASYVVDVVILTSGQAASC